MSTVAAVYGRREVEFGIFPSSQRRGGRASNKWIPSEIGAAGVVSSPKLFRPKHFAGLTTPSAASSVASRLLLMPQPSPPLRGGEYLELNFSPIHSYLPWPPVFRRINGIRAVIDRRYSRFRHGLRVFQHPQVIQHLPVYLHNNRFAFADSAT